MKKKTARKLVLNRETLHALGNLQGVFGGLRRTDDFVTASGCGDCTGGGGTNTYDTCLNTYNFGCSNQCATGGACTT
jgi:hypothetical protein